jgi:hypothetical protein
MFRRLAVCIFVILSISSIMAEDRIVAIESFVVRVSDHSSLTLLQSFDSTGAEIASGTSDPVVSPDQKWIAFTKDGNVFLEKPDKKSVIQVNQDGTPSTKTQFAVNSLIVGFAPDSKQLIFTVAPGKADCPDCPSHQQKKRPAAYGFYLYTIATKRISPFALPGSIRVNEILDLDRIFITRVGNYGDEMGILNLKPKESFVSLQKACAQAASCSLSKKGAIADCTAIEKGQARIVECDNTLATERAITDPGHCITEFQMPQRSPAGQHLAYIQLLGECKSNRHALWIDQKSAFECEALTAYTWVDESRLITRCRGELKLIDLSGKKLQSIQVPTKPN